MGRGHAFNKLAPLMYKHVGKVYNVSGCGFPPPQVPVEVYAQYCHKKVEKMTQMGAKKGLKRPTLVEIIHAKVLLAFTLKAKCRP